MLVTKGEAMTELRKWRYVEDGPESLNVYQCLCCRGTFSTDRLRDWQYCPRCGVRWDGEHACRPHAVPRWAWDRYGPQPPCDLDCGRSKPAASAEWVIQCRTKWNDEPCSDWTPDAYSPTFDVRDGSWRDVRDFLEMCRSQREPDVAISCEYRATIRPKRS